MRSNVFAGLVTLLMVAFWAMGCEKEAPPSAYDPSVTGGAQPIITGIDPQGSALANVTTLTIHGQNFSAVPGENLVFFDATVATVTTASATQLQMRAPNLVKDSIAVKIAVQGSQLFSSAMVYKLEAAALDFGKFQPGESPAGIECDTAGNIYVSIASNQLDLTGVKKITPAGDRSDYSPIFSAAVSNWRNMRFGPGGALFCVSGRNIIFSIPPGGGASVIWLSGGGLTTLSDLDFDQDGNIWAAGAGGSICRVRPDKTVKKWAFTGTMRAVRVFNGNLYVGGLQGTSEKVWVFPIISADSLGPAQDYFDFSASYSGTVQCITFGANGDLYIGTDSPEGIVVVDVARSHGPLYPGVISPTCGTITWATGNKFFQGRTGTSPTLVLVNAQKPGAPYYGRTLP